MAEKRPYDGSASCGGCDARWTGVARAHCAACHRTFGGPSLFDAHRRFGCKDPAKLRTKKGEPLMFLVDGIWQTTPEPSRRAESLRAWRKANAA